MIKVTDLKGKFFLIDDEYVLSVQASIIVSKDEDGYVQNEYFEFVKVLDEDGFEIDEIGLMCAEKTGGFNLVNYRHSSGVYHEQETEDLHRRI